MRAGVALALLLPSSLVAQTTTRSAPVAVMPSGAATGVAIRSGAGQAESINIVNGTTAGFAVLYDAPNIPADGTLNVSLIRWCMPVAANVGISDPFRAPRTFYNGLSFFVSSASCTSKTAVSYGFVAVQAAGQ